MKVIDILQTLRESALGKQIVAQAAAEERKTRQDLVAQVAELREHLKTEGARLAPPVEVARANVHKAYEAVRAAEQQYARATGECIATTCGIERRIAMVEWDLREGADPALAALVRELRAKEEELRRIPVSLSYAQDRAGIMQVIGTTADEQLAERMALFAAAREAEALQLQELGDKLPLKLNEIRTRAGLRAPEVQA